MQVNVNQDTAVRQYTQNVQSARTVTAPVTDTKEEASASAVQKDVDRAEFSKDTAYLTSSLCGLKKIPLHTEEVEALR